MSFLAPATRVGPLTPAPQPTPYGTIAARASGPRLVVTETYTADGRPHTLRLMTFGTHAALAWIRATGPWLVYRETAPGGLTKVGAVGLVSPNVSLALGTYARGDLQAVAVGSHRVAVDAGGAALLLALPPTAAASVPVPVQRTYPASAWPLLARSLEEGYDAGSLRVPGLPATPPRYPGLRSYNLGSYSIPLEAPAHWMVTAPAVKRGVTAIQIVNPANPREWVAIVLNPKGRILTVPPIARATVALSDVTLAFESPGPHGTVYNGVLYPSVTGGTSEIVVALPNAEHHLAQEILDSVGLPY
jgi:hypothetical protein